jgi:hypothetical protein
MREYLELFDPVKATAYGFGQGPNWKIRTARLCLKQIGLSEELLKHGIKREIYGIPLAYNFKEFLRGETNKLNQIDIPFNEVNDYWKTRWFIERAKRKPEYKNFNKYDVSKVIHKVGIE